jgi:hypothetical protein
MIIEKTRYYTITQSFASRTENEYEVYDINQNRAGYVVENALDNTFEVYHNADSDFEDYSSIDYADNYSDAIQIILRELEYDMN